jgi:ArsR family transcriptional regulator
VTEQETRLLAAKAEILKALAHPSRLWMVERLARGECCVCELVRGVNADFSTVSKHLSVLKKSGILEDEKRGKQVFYRLRIPCLLRFMDCIEAVVPDSGKR